MRQMSYTVELSPKELWELRCADEALKHHARQWYPVFDRFHELGNGQDSLNAWRKVAVRPPMRFSTEGDFMDSMKREPLPILFLGELLEGAVGVLNTKELGGLMVWLAGRIAARDGKDRV